MLFLEMINQYIIKAIIYILSIFDYSNKIKIKNFFIKQFQHSSLNIIDIGAHKGETIKFFLKNFTVNKIFSFEPNIELFIELKKQNYPKENVEIFNYGVGKENKRGNLKIMNDTSSSTFNDLNENTQYFKKKKTFLSIFSKNNSLIQRAQSIEIINLSTFLHKKDLSKIDILKIDTEGYEYNILKGIEKLHFKKIKFIYFEHHFDLMIEKKYKFFDINEHLINNNFKQKLKMKMKFRKSFEYIYENQA